MRRKVDVYQYRCSTMSGSLELYDSNIHGKMIPGSQYSASKEGDIWSLVMNKPRIMKQCMSTTGYPMVSLWIDGRKKTKKTHQYIAQAWLGDRPEGMQVCHNDGVRTNNSVENLRYDTPKSNYLKETE